MAVATQPVFLRAELETREEARVIRIFEMHLRLCVAFVTVPVVPRGALSARLLRPLRPVARRPAGEIPALPSEET